MATLSNPVNNPTLDGSESSCTTDNDRGAISYLSKTEAFTGDDSQITEEIIADGITIPVADFNPSATITGQAESTAYNLGWVQDVSYTCYVRADGTAGDKDSATGGSAAASMSLATFSSQVWGPGDTVYLDGTGGDFGSRPLITAGSIGNSASPITIQGINGAKVNSSSGSAFSVAGGAQFVNIHDMELDGSATTASVIVAGGAGNDLAGSTITFSNCTIVGRGFQYIVQLEANAQAAFTGCAVTDAAGGTGIGYQAQTNTVLRLTDCTAVNCTTSVRASYKCTINGGSYTGSTVAPFEAYVAGSVLTSTDATVTTASGSGYPLAATDCTVFITGGSWTAAGEGLTNISGYLEMTSISPFVINGANIVQASLSGTVLFHDITFDWSVSDNIAKTITSTSVLKFERCTFDMRGFASSARKICSGSGASTVYFTSNEVWAEYQWYSPGVVSPGAGGILYARNNSVHNGRRTFHYNDATLRGELVNNIMHTCDAEMDTTSMTTVSSNNIFGGTVWGGANETTTDPLFANLTDDMRLQSGSPAKDTGEDWWTGEDGYALDRDGVTLVDCRGAFES